MHASGYVENGSSLVISTAVKDEVATQRHRDSLAESSRCREAVGDEIQQDEPYAEEGEQECEERVRRFVAGTITTARGVGGAVADDDGPGCGYEEDDGVGDQAASVGEVDGVSSSEHGGGHAKADSRRVFHSVPSGSESRRA